MRAASRLVRNLSASEPVVAGDLGDRGPRLDRVIDYLMAQPRVSIAWGNHDVSWMGACLGHEALIATVLRISLRYRRLCNLEEGYGLIMSPLEKLARDVYADDPAERFLTRGTGLRDDLLMAQMQKAVANHAVQAQRPGQPASSPVGNGACAICCIASRSRRGTVEISRPCASAARIPTFLLSIRGGSWRTLR